MCGIVGYIGLRPAVPVLIGGLEQLEYRGYDSAGIACLDEKNRLFLAREKGKIRVLKARIGKKQRNCRMGIGHTRWATHGEPSKRNAHPHVDASGRVILIHNGIIENHAALKAELRAEGVRFQSDTDTEVAANLIGYYLRTSSFEQAFIRAIKRLQGFFAFVAMSPEDPERLYVFRRSNPLCIGLGKGENFIASDVTPLLPYTHRVLYLEDEEYGIVTRDRVQLFSLAKRKPVRREPVRIRWNVAQARKGGYPHFMLKEIYEQPAVLKETLSKRLDRKGHVHFDTLKPEFVRRMAKVREIHMVSCGTAYHAGLVGSLMIEELARIKTTTQVSSEFRYGDPLVGSTDMVVFITQSGETADTLAAMREARERGALTLALVNVVGSTIAREADAVIYTHAGPEIGVASTKAYTAQLATLACLALFLGSLRQKMRPAELKQWTREFRKLPEYARSVLEQDRAVTRCARRFAKGRNFLYLGRRYHFPTALEGALKLKEITYAHAHGYAAGEMKHGPIALIDSKQPVICIAPRSKTYDKMLANIEEIRARRGRVIAIGTEGDRDLKKSAESFFSIPPTRDLFTPILAVLPLQLFAYRVAVENGRDVDQPRNLAKSVTVE